MRHGPDVVPPGAAILSALADGAVLTGRDGSVLAVNRAFGELTGFEPEALVGRREPYPWTWADADGRHDGPGTLIRRANGDACPVLVSAADLRDADGAFAGRALIFRDITEQAIADRALREAETRFRTVFDDAPIGMAIISLRGTYVRVNRALADMLGYAPEELAHMPVSGVTHPDDRDADRDVLAALVAGGAAIDRRVKRYIAPGGRVVWAELTASLVRDADGQPLHVVAQIRDITQEREEQRARERAEAMVGHAFEHSPIGVLLIAAGGRILRANEATAAILGRDPQTLTRLTLDELTVPDEADDTRAAVERLLEGDYERAALEARFRHGVDGEVWGELALALVRDADGTPCYLLAHLQDVTARRRYEAELTAS